MHYTPQPSYDPEQDDDIESQREAELEAFYDAVEDAARRIVRAEIDGILYDAAGVNEAVADIENFGYNEPNAWALARMRADELLSMEMEMEQ